MWQHESRTDGQSLKQGLPYPISAIIQLSDYDQTLHALSWVGYRVDIGWGYSTSSGDRYSEGSPSIVVMAESLSRQGQLVMELSCISLWDLQRIKLVNVTTASIIDYRLADLYKVKHVLQEWLGGSPLGNPTDLNDGALVVYDASGPAYTSYTVASRNITEDDVLLLPAVPAVGDIAYFGYVDPFDRISIDMRTAGAGYSGIWEYWNGAWAGFGITPAGSAKDFQVARMSIVSFGRPTDWATLNASTAGPTNAAFPNKALYYIRYRVLSLPGALTQPVASRVFVDQDVAFEIDSTDAAQGESAYVDYQTSLEANLTESVEAILSLTLMGIILKKDGFHARYIDNAQAGQDYTYGSVQPMYENRYRVAVAIPNSVQVTNAVPGTAGAVASDPLTNGLNAASQTAIGLVRQVVVLVTANTVPLANTFADRMMAQIVRDLTQGQMLALMECGQEVWDLAQVVDTRLNKTYIGRVSEILRIWDSGAASGSSARYQIEVTMGGQESLKLFQAGPLPEPVAKPEPAGEEIEAPASRLQLDLDRQFLERTRDETASMLRSQQKYGLLNMPTTLGDPYSLALRKLGIPFEEQVPPGPFREALTKTEAGRRLQRTLDILAGVVRPEEKK